MDNFADYRISQAIQFEKDIIMDDVGLRLMVSCNIQSTKHAEFGLCLSAVIFILIYSQTLSIISSKRVNVS